MYILVSGCFECNHMGETTFECGSYRSQGTLEAEFIGVASVVFLLEVSASANCMNQPRCPLIAC